MGPRKKVFKIRAEEIRQLIPSMGGCIASDRITVDGAPVGLMYHEEPDDELTSGWWFFSGDESREYNDNGENFGVYEVNTVCNFDPAIIPYLDAPVGKAFRRVPGTDRFEHEEFDEHNHRRSSLRSVTSQLVNPFLKLLKQLRLLR